jgi:hypothetical protein
MSSVTVKEDSELSTSLATYTPDANVLLSCQPKDQDTKKRHSTRKISEENESEES